MPLDICTTHGTLYLIISAVLFLLRPDIPLPSFMICSIIITILWDMCIHYYIINFAEKEEMMEAAPYLEPMDEDNNYVWVSIATGKVYFNMGRLQNYSAHLLKCHFEIEENLAKPKLFITYTQPYNKFLKAFYLFAPNKTYYFVIPTESYKIIK